MNTTLPQLQKVMTPSGVEITATVKDNRAYFSPRHVCKSLGIGWATQFEKIKDDSVLGSTVRVIETVAADGRRRPQFMLPIEMLSGSPAR